MDDDSQAQGVQEVKTYFRWKVSCKVAFQYDI